MASARRGGVSPAGGDVGRRGGDRGADDRLGVDAARVRARPAYSSASSHWPVSSSAQVITMSVAPVAEHGRGGLGLIPQPGRLPGVVGQQGRGRQRDVRSAVDLARPAVRGWRASLAARSASGCTADPHHTPGARRHSRRSGGRLPGAQAAVQRVSRSRTRW